MKKNVYFVQLASSYGKTIYLPYAVGAIIANCLKYPEIESQYRFPEIIFTRDKLDFVLSKMKDPYMVAFSCNVWNIEYNKALAKRIKEKFPKCIVAFGGHSAGEDGSLLKEFKYIDVLVFGEGETVFAQLLKKLPDRKINEVKSIAYRQNGEIITTPRGCVEDLSELPSPYTSGIFDSILENYKDYQLDAVIETNRGCPYSCSYCDWTHGKRMRFFTMEKIKSEIDWAADNKIKFIYCGDSNFGLFERDTEVVDYLVKKKQEKFYPEVFRANYDKNSDERVFVICKKLNEYGMDKGVTMSFQTLCSQALENIGRKNLTLEHFSRLMERYTRAGIPTYSELILGLPGETYESFCKGICTLLEKGQHNTICVYPCEILPNAVMSSDEYMKKYKIETVKVRYRNFHGVASASEEVEEYSELIRSTYSMNRNDWVRAHLFSACSLGFHTLPMLRFFAEYLHYEKKVDYFEFYSNLLEYLLKSSGVMGNVLRDMKSRLDNSLQNGKAYFDKRIGNTGWTYEEGFFLQAAVDIELTFKELIVFLKQYDIEPDVFNDLTEYQMAMVRDANSKEKILYLKYDLPKYFDNVNLQRCRPLTQRKTIIKITPDKEFADFETYAREVVWYGRRNEAAVYKNKEIEVLYEKF